MTDTSELAPDEQRTEPLRFGYTNYRGEYGERTAIPIRVWFGSTKWHQEPQWLMEALDLDRGERRDFAIADMGLRARPADQAHLATAINAVRTVMHALPIGFVLSEISPANHLMHALTVLQSIERQLVGKAGWTSQERVQPWMLACFGELISSDKEERNHRFLEEALELVQACGCSASEAHQLVDYVYGRPVGARSQEVGGVMVTLAAMCLAQGLDMHAEGEIELQRINAPAMVEKIRAKQAAKPKHSPLPEEPKNG